MKNAWRPEPPRENGGLKAFFINDLTRRDSASRGVGHRESAFGVLVNWVMKNALLASVSFG